MHQADFYILPASEPSARVNFLCRLLEQIQGRDLSALILVDTEDEAKRLDRQLWDYRPDAFLPHHLHGTEPTSVIAISHQLPSLPGEDVLINLGSQNQAIFAYPRIVEIVIQETQVLAVTRQRYQQYREQEWTLNRHDMRKSPSA